jgi:hypothetical protein
LEITEVCRRRVKTETLEFCSKKERINKSEEERVESVCYRGELVGIREVGGFGGRENVDVRVE